MNNQYSMILTSEVYVFYEDELLLFKRSLDKKKFPGFYSLPGGHIEANEDPVAAAVRELREETGICVENETLTLRYVVMHRHIDREEEYQVFAFSVYLDEKPMLHSDSEEGNPEWVKIKDIESIENIFPPIKYYFKHVFSGSNSILFNRSKWEKSQLIRVLSETIV